MVHDNFFVESVAIGFEKKAVKGDIMQRIWVDADAVPRVIKELLIKASQRREVEMVFVANMHLGIRQTQRVKTVQVAAGADVADDHIAENCQPGELVITADIPLAARAITAGAVVLTPRGDVINKDNIPEKLSMRDFATDLRDIGIDTGGAPPFHPKDKQRFANGLDRWLTRGWL